METKKPAPSREIKRTHLDLRMLINPDLSYRIRNRAARENRTYNAMMMHMAITYLDRADRARTRRRSGRANDAC